MRWVPLFALLLLMAWPGAAQEGEEEGIEIDGQPTGPEEPEPEKPAPKPAPAPPPEEPPEESEPGDESKPPTAEEINRAADRGVAWLRKAQKGDGSWGPCVAGGVYGDPRSRERSTCYEMGPTAFSIFALATCGVSRDDPVVRHGLAWIQKAGRGHDWTSYESSAAILALTALNGTKAPVNAKSLPRSSGARPPKGIPFRYEDWSMMTTRVQALLECTDSGGFRYWSRGDSSADVSATQFAILALRSASFAGYPVEKTRPDVWARAAAFLGGVQESSGGFPYHRNEGPSRGMTAAGVSSLLICREQMALKKDAESPGIRDRIEKGLAYLNENFSLTNNPSPHFEGRNHYHYCHLYALERTGVLSGRREFDGLDWYVRGAAYLLEEQASDGSWDDDTCMGPQDILGTCFALLFLKRATPPAVTVSGD